MTRSIKLLAIGAVTLLLGLQALLASLLLAGSLWLQPWLAALAAGVALGGVGAILIVLGWPHLLSMRSLHRAEEHLVPEALRGVTEMLTGKEAKTMMEAVMRNPIPAILVGAGLGWMLLDATRGSNPLARITGRRVDRAEPSNELEAANGSSTLGGTASDASRRAGALANDHPVALGAVGVAVGATVAVALAMAGRDGGSLGETHAGVLGSTDLGDRVLRCMRAIAEECGRASIGVIERELGLDRDSAHSTH